MCAMQDIALSRICGRVPETSLSKEPHMERKQENHHFHIRWSGKNTLDWESFGSREEAEASAKQLVRQGETYTIEEYGLDCPRCAAALNLKRAHPAPAENPKPGYPWQEAVLDASRESRSEFLPVKVNAAQRAISARLCEKMPTD